MRYSPEFIERAENMYVMDGMSHKEIARELGTAVATIQRWSDRGEWKTIRSEYMDMDRYLRRNMYTLRKKAMEMAVGAPDPQTIYAVARLETLTLRDKKEQAENGENGIEVDIPKLFLDHMRFVIDYLKGNDPEGVKVLARNWDGIVGAFKEQHGDG